MKVLVKKMDPEKLLKPETETRRDGRGSYRVEKKINGSGNARCEVKL